VSLAARHIEASGIPTVVCGSARDIVEQAAVPRFLFTDFPLGNSTGKPYDAEMQKAITSMALDLLESARFPQTTVRTPFTWDGDEWRGNYMRVDEANLEELRRAGEERRERQAARKDEGRARTS
jgi:hypothetical protein